MDNTPNAITNSNASPTATTSREDTKESQSSLNLNGKSGNPNKSSGQSEMSMNHHQLSPSDSPKDCHRPPMSVIVVSSGGTRDSSASASRPTERIPGSSLSSPFSTPFRLKPRNALGVAATTRDGGDAERGRKRSAQSMTVSTMNRDSLLTAKSNPKQQADPQATVISNACSQQTAMASSAATEVSSSASTPKRPPLVSTSTPPNGRRGLSNTVMNFQCLSLQSPRRNDPATADTSPPRSLFISPPRRHAGAAQGSSLGLLPPSSASSSSSSRGINTSVLLSSSGGSHPSQRQQQTASHTLPPRSSFTPVYSTNNSVAGALSPGGASIRSIGSNSIGSNTKMNLCARPAYSPGNGSTLSSPKIAPLTVLKDHGGKLPQREAGARLPPLPGGGINSLWLSLESSADGDHKKQQHPMVLPARKDDSSGAPPRMVHCRKPSSDSISTVQNSVISPMARLPSPKTPQATASPGKHKHEEIMKTWTPQSNKQMRLENFTSPSHRSVSAALATTAGGTPRTPQTPLPRVTLTPRSSSSRRSGSGAVRGAGMPRFPSPSDIDMDVTSPFLSSVESPAVTDAPPPSFLSMTDSTSATTPGHSFGRPPRNGAAIRSSFPDSSNSLALSADGSVHDDKESRFGNNGAAKKVGRATMARGERSAEDCGGMFMGIQTRSLLTGSHSGGILAAMMEENERAMNSDMGSVSDIDDDEGFVLASPSVVEEERYASMQPARQRRRCSFDPQVSSTGASLASNGARGNQGIDFPNIESNTSLTGMNNVTSNTSLFGMDIAHPSENNIVGLSCDTRPSPEAVNPSQLLDSATATGARGSLAIQPPVPFKHGLDRRKSDSSFASIGLALDGNATGDSDGRDLVTPPAMPNPQTPPPLSPKNDYYMPSGFASASNQNVGHCDVNIAAPGNVCISDRRAVTMAIARMAFEAQHHSAESSPVL